MTAYTVCTLVLLAGGLGPALALSAVGEPVSRLVGLQLVSVSVTVALILFSQLPQGQSFDLTLPLVLVPLSFAGTLVFTRLLAKRESHDA